MKSIIKISLLAAIPLVVFCAFSFSVGTEGEAYSVVITEVIAQEIVPPALSPTCSLAVLPATVVRGQNATLSWSTFNATSASIDKGVGSVSTGLGRSQTITPANTTTYTMTVTGPGGTANCTATVTVTEPPVPKVCTIRASAASVEFGGSVTITWETSGFDSVTVNGAAVSNSGSNTYTNITVSTLFSLHAETADGKSQCNTNVNVTCVTPPVAPVCNSFTANPTSVLSGQTTTLTWTTTNATTVTIDRGVGSVPVDGSKVITVPTSAGSYVYTLTATASDGAQVSCPVTVTVTTVPAPTCDSFTANPTAITVGGSSVLTWATTNATAVSINQGIGAVALDGTKSISPTQTTTYTLTATANGVSVTCPVTVTVTTVPVPVCNSFTANPTTILPGASTTLTWATTNATSVTINQGIGSVAVDGTRSVTPTQTTTYTLTATASGVSVTCPVTVTVTTPDPVPVCTLSANPTAINAGQSSTLTWTSQNAVTRVINQGIGSVDVNGTRSVNPGVTTTYTMTVTSASGVERTCAATITVTPVVNAPTCDSFTALPTTILKGATSTLTWTTTNADTVTINNGIGSVSLDGNRIVSPLETTTYTLTASAHDGRSVTCPATITVTVPDTVPTCDSFTAAPTTLPAGGGTTVLSWTTTNADTVTIDNGIGSVSGDGSRSVTLTQTTNYILTATDADGDQVSCPLNVLVTPPVPTPISCQDNVSLSINPQSIDEGETATLTWSTTGITSVQFEGISSSALSGSQTVSPSSDTTYTLVATTGNETVRCPISIDVDEDDGGGGGGSSTPRCELSISDSTISSGERVTLAWETSNATTVIIKDSFGKTLITTEGVLSSDKDDLYDGEMTLRPEKDTTYTLTAERGDRDRECTVKVDVDGSVVVLQTRDQLPLVSGISLTQVPYTGFEAGPMLTVIFYSLLVIWAMYLAYILVIGKSGVPVAVMAASSTQSFTPERVVSSAPVASPVVPAPPVFTTMAAVAPIHESLQVGYHGTVATTDEATLIENQAHAAQVLLSSDAMRYFMATTEGMNRTEVLASIISHAKASFPSEDGWVVLNEERVTRSCTECLAVAATPSSVAPFIPATMPIGNSSLAEAIVTGNIVAAYQMIGNRPMIALTDAAADLDALYRVKQGVDASVSTMLVSIGAAVPAEKLHAAINALTSALDGTYTTEAEAVKMAIMKATKAINN